ncbi:tripartite tricarboxylate transporter permease [Telmatospirillum sp. J64-1]|uniref:tripartite tricarboxylate transporter permease n=1 Tax=Telmatospirillum sp. J64-1 TaxID=2502183 RepID=UPI00115CFF27|nr:tripartite tricarboxylate transporter permease [Telmatospirillum sp. J64-1]
MENILQALAVLLTPGNFGLLTLAVLGGIIIGAIPGLTPAVAIGLLIPFTFSFEAYSAFILLLGIYVGSMYGGSIPAILMNLPGTPASAVTALDGYQLAKKGRAGEALGVSILSGTLGGIVSCVFLIFLSLELSTVALRFGGPEYFALCVFAVVVVLALASDSLLKGAMGAGLGLLISTIGIDPVTPYPRFTFGMPELMIGIPIVPATIGLFCVAEGFRMMENTGAGHMQQRALSGMWTACRQLNRLWGNITRSGIIGTFIGILPGIGATVGSYMAYVAARGRARKEEKAEFGKGSISGVAASESANNAVVGGTMIPLMTLGIPGDINTLLMVGAMQIHGLVPGPSLFRDQLVLVYVIFGAVVFANLLILVLGFGLTGPVARLASTPKKYLIPIVLVVAITGPAISYGHVYYFWVAIVFGLVGYVCEKGGYPVLAIAMGLILGPILEENLRSSLMLPGANLQMFFLRPISAAFLLLSIFVLAYAVYRAVKQRRSLAGRIAAESVQ